MNANRKTAVLATAGAALLALSLAACNGNPNSNNVEHNEANAGIDLILSNQPVPVFASSAQRQDMIEAEAIMALGTPTTTFFFPQGVTVVNGRYSAPPFKTCPSEGEPIPNTASLTNPEQQTSGGSVAVGQMDPDGIYAPSASNGTYVMCDTASGGQKLDYWEGPVYAESGEAVWDAATGTIEDIGVSKLPVCTLTRASSGDGTNLAAGTKYYHCEKA